MPVLLPTIAAIAERQLGLVTLADLRDEGVPEATIWSAVESGRLERVERGVYRQPGSPRTSNQRLLALVLAAHPLARISHRSAAWSWGFGSAPIEIHLTVPRGVRFRRPGVRTHQSTDLDLAIPGCKDGVPITDVGRTILDCAADPAVDLQLLIDEARLTQSFSRSLLADVVRRHARRGRPGIQRLREHLVEVGLPASEFERLFGRFLHDSGIGGWELHHRLVAGGRPIEVDIAWPSLRIAIELDGSDHWERIARYHDDAARQNLLELDGWLVLRFTYARFLTEPRAIVAEIFAALASRR